MSGNVSENGIYMYHRMFILLSMIMIVIRNNICKQQISGLRYFNFPDTSTITITPHIMLLVVQEPLTLLEHPSSIPVFSWGRATRFVALCVCFVVRWLSFCLSFSFGSCVYSPSTYGCGLPLWYLQTLL